MAFGQKFPRAGREWFDVENVLGKKLAGKAASSHVGGDSGWGVGGTGAACMNFRENFMRRDPA